MPTKEKNKRSLKPEFIKWSERSESVRGILKGFTWQDMEGGAVPKYRLDTDDGPVSFLGSVQLVEALENVRNGSDVEIVPGEKVKTGKNRFVQQFDVFVYEDEVGEADKPERSRIMVTPEGVEVEAEEVAA